jgi:PAS domain S-box-containing protein
LLALSPVRSAERVVAAIGGTRLSLGVTVLALLATRLTWPLLQPTPFALLIVSTIVAAQRADERLGLLLIPISAAAQALLFRGVLPAAGSGQGFAVFMVVALGLNRLIVSRRRVEAALRASEAELRSGWEHAAVGAALLDLRGHVTRVNPAFARLFGRLGDGRRAVHYRELLRQVDGEDDRELFEDLIAGRRDEYRREQAYQGEGDSVIWARGVMSLVRDDEQRPVRALLLLEDITDRKVLEEQVRQAQKLDTMGRLVATVAHDFNNLLTAIGGYADLAYQGVDSPVARRHLGEVLSVTRRATALTRQLLMFSRRPSVDPAPLRLDEAIDASMALVRGLVGPNVSVVTALGARGATVKLDPSHLEQIVVNLAINARDAMPAGGRLSIDTSLVVLPNASVAATAAQLVPGPYVLLTVSDTGVGMDEQVRARLFEPFFTTKKAEQGTGIGLSTVYGIVKLYGAYILVESEPGHGSRFKIYFPQDPRSVQPAEPADVRHRASAEQLLTRPAIRPARGTRILVVEDDTSVRSFTCTVLRDAGYDAVDA